MIDYINESELKHRHNEEIQELHRQLKQKDQILNTYRKEHGKLEVFFRQIMDSIDPITPLPKIKIEEMKASNPINLVMHITDSHMGAVQDPDEIEGFNIFSPDICEKRCIGFSRAFIEWTKMLRNSYKINKCHVLMTGDLISGDIHDELRITNAFPVPEQCVRSAQVHAKQIALLAPYFNEIIVEFLTEDNHSRLTAKPQAKEAGKNSFNYIVGILLETYLRKHKNIDFHLHAMNSKVVHVSTRNYLLKHGHDIRGWMGVPWYGVERMVAKEITARNNLIMQDYEMAHEIGFDKIIHGHFHTPFDHTLYMCGGSVSGTDAYDHKNGRHAEPSQSAWAVHPKYGEFNRTNFQLKYYDKIK